LYKALHHQKSLKKQILALLNLVVFCSTCFPLGPRTLYYSLCSTSLYSELTSTCIAYSSGRKIYIVLLYSPCLLNFLYFPPLRVRKFHIFVFNSMFPFDYFKVLFFRSIPHISRDFIRFVI
jgi:hypothetical protein